MDGNDYPWLLEEHVSHFHVLRARFSAGHRGLSLRVVEPGRHRSPVVAGTVAANWNTYEPWYGIRLSLRPVVLASQMRGHWQELRPLIKKKPMWHFKQTARNCDFQRNLPILELLKTAKACVSSTHFISKPDSLYCENSIMRSCVLNSTGKLDTSNTCGNSSSFRAACFDWYSWNNQLLNFNN